MDLSEVRLQMLNQRNFKKEVEEEKDNVKHPVTGELVFFTPLPTPY